MINFPVIAGAKEPRQKKMSSAEYITFCDFCLKNNPHITPENCLDRKTGDETLKEAFRL